MNRRRVLTIGILVGAAFPAFAVLAPSVGLGGAEDFVLFRLAGLPRRTAFEAGVLIALLMPFAVDPWEFILRPLGVLAGLIKHVASPTSAFIAGVIARSSARITKGTRRVLDLRFGAVLKVLAINAAVLLLLLSASELLVRTLIPEPSIYASAQPGQYFRFQPYLETSNEGPLDRDGVWYDAIHKLSIPYHIKSNALGFRMDRELDTTTVYKKGQNEKVVLIFGGSAVYGFGSTSNAATIAGALERDLNTAQSAVHYTVFNMGNGGWVAYQELIAFNLYGLNLSPDVVIFMDGRNDVFTLAKLAGYDVGFQFNTSQIGDLVDGYLYRQAKPDFYRGWLENEIVRLSRTYRLLTGKRYVPSHQAMLFSPARDWSFVDRTVDFYLRTQASVLRECAHCRYILSTQPIYRPGRNPMTGAQRAAVAKKYHDIKIGGGFLSDPRFDDILMYSYGRIIDEMPEICAERGPSCTYKDIDEVFPADDNLKQKYFVDDVHMNDEGYAMVARYYADVVLRTRSTKSVTLH